jgi:UDP-N-acetylmuramate dehydrogenase
MQERVSLKEHTTLKLGGQARYFFICKDEEDLVQVSTFAKSKKMKVFPLGGGSNIVVSDDIKDLVCVKMENKGIEIIGEDTDTVLISVSAGEDWDSFVGFTVERNLSGLEMLSGIPGTVGASPIQNIGAYGGQVSSTIEDVRGYSLKTNTFEILHNNDCQFSYRDSIFKHELKENFIVTSVVFKLSKKVPQVPKYPMVETELEKTTQDFPNMSLVQRISLAVKKIRSGKLPDPKEIPNVGSFFKNVFVREDEFKKLSQSFQDLPIFREGDEYKIPAGWMIEKVGYKGYKVNGVGVHDKHALVLINISSDKTHNLLLLADDIKSKVFDKFGLKLEIEPEIIT